MAVKFRLRGMRSFMMEEIARFCIKEKCFYDGRLLLVSSGKQYFLFDGTNTLNIIMFLFFYWTVWFANYIDRIKGEIRKNKDYHYEMNVLVLGKSGTIKYSDDLKIR